MLIKNTNYYNNNMFFQVNSFKSTRANIPNQSQGDSVKFGSLHGISYYNNHDWVVTDTDFFRDLNILKFITNYSQENFPDGVVVFDAGCSNGEESYSLGMLLNEAKTKFKIIGFDVNPEVDTQRYWGEYQVYTRGHTGSDEFLISAEPEKDKDKQECKKIFNKYFKEISKYRASLNFDSINDKYYYDKKRKMGDNFKEAIFKADRKLRSNMEFHIGDIREMDKWKLISDEQPHVFIFKNAWYHLTDNDIQSKNDNEIKDIKSNLNKIVKNVHDLLPEKGLFVIGGLPRDHLYRSENDHKIIEPSPFHEILKNNGFEPVLYSDMPDTYIPGTTLPLHYDKKLPSIWKKVR